MKRFLAGAVAGATALTLTAGCAEQVRQFEPKLELKSAGEKLGATGKGGFTLKAGGNVDDLIALAKKQSGAGEDAFTDSDAATLRKLYNSSFTMAWDKAGDGAADDKALINATVDGVTGAEIRVVDEVTYMKMPVDELAARFGASKADINSFRQQAGASIGGIDTLINGNWISIAAADLKKLSQGQAGATPSADPQQNEKLAAELRTSAENLLEGAEVVRDKEDENHLTVTTSTVKAYEQGTRLIEVMKKSAGDPAARLLDGALGAKLKAPADKPIVMDLWVDNGTFKAFEINFLQFVAGNTGRATLRVDVSSGADIAAPDGAKKLDLTKVFDSAAGPGAGPRDGGAENWAEMVGSQAVLTALTEGGKPAVHLKKAAVDMAVPGVTVKIVRRGVAQVTSAGSVACVTVPATSAGRPKVVKRAC